MPGRDMTTVYFVRHAQPDYTVKDDRQRPLTEAGLQASLGVAKALDGRRLDRIFSSPYRRACDTLRDLAGRRGLEITLVEDFRERRVDSVWVDDFKAFSRRQWEDFDFRLKDGESLRQVQQRNVAALNALLRRHPGEHFAIGTHGTALSTVLNHFDPGFGYEAFWSIVDRMPWIVCLEFEGLGLQRQYPLG